MTADIVENSTSSAVIVYGCALSRLRFADRRYSDETAFFVQSLTTIRIFSVTDENLGLPVTVSAHINSIGSNRGGKFLP